MSGKRLENAEPNFVSLINTGSLCRFSAHYSNFCFAFAPYCRLPGPIMMTSKGLQLGRWQKCRSVLTENGCFLHDPQKGGKRDLLNLKLGIKVDLNSNFNMFKSTHNARKFKLSFQKGCGLYYDATFNKVRPIK